mmetsp:Transcript_19249/g.41358  ORF Transcript_19249/g.41358 Transcript_19249/m.41358 type:complete len:202 (-) Transcript_19249:329-934(-)
MITVFRRARTVTMIHRRFEFSNDEGGQNHVGSRMDNHGPTSSLRKAGEVPLNAAALKGVKHLVKRTLNEAIGKIGVFEVIHILLKIMVISFMIVSMRAVFGLGIDRHVSNGVVTLDIIGRGVGIRHLALLAHHFQCTLFHEAARRVRVGEAGSMTIISRVQHTKRRAPFSLFVRTLFDRDCDFSPVNAGSNELIPRVQSVR